MRRGGRGTDRNRDVYGRRSVVRHYRHEGRIQGVEQAVLDDLADEVRGRRILDIGVGGGRTAGQLAELAGTYLGIDYSDAMVAAAGQRHPGLRFEVRDARDLSAYADGSFEVAVFSFNGIDYVGHADRLRILAEVRRVLVPGGLFVFSSHNRDHDRYRDLPWQGRRPTLRSARTSLLALGHLPRHLRMSRRETHADEYAIVNDEAHGFGLLTYYVSPARQLRQLAEAGFGDVVLYDFSGRVEDRPVSGDSVWVYYAARVPIA